MRHALLDGAFKRIGGALDIDQLAREFVNIAVPHFCNTAGLLILESLVAGDELPADSPGRVPAAAPARGGLRRRRLRLGRGVPDRGDPALPAGHAVHRVHGHRQAGPPEALGSDQAARIATSWLRLPVAQLLANTSLLLLPLAARDVTLGFVVCTRKDSYRAFDAYDTEIGMEFASRAAIFIDNARRYSRERATALTLQRSLLPTGLSTAVVGRGAAPLPARQQADRGRRRLVRVDRAARRAGRAGRGRRGRARCARRGHHGPAAHRDPHPGHARAVARRRPCSS